MQCASFLLMEYTAYMEMKKDAFFKNRKVIDIVCITGIVLLAFLLLSSGVRTTPSSAKIAFADEFAGAYSELSEQNGTIQEVDIIADESVLEIFEGHLTAVWTYNGTVPGPEIRIQKGDTLRIHFTNNLPQESTLHFHGIRVPNTMDGVPDVTQKPVQAGDSFVYTFTPKDAGTFWFHPHKNTSEQLERGLYGTIIVEDEHTGQYSQDAVWVVDDWLLEETYQINPHFVTQHDLTHDGRWGNVITVNSSTEEILSVYPGERIRLRLVNVSNGRVYSLHFGGLPAYGIAVDGMYVKEVFNADGFVLAPGNRIDVDITVPKDADGRSFTIQDRFTRYVNTLGSIVVAGEEKETPQFSYPTNPKIPDWSDVIHASVDAEYLLDARQTATGDIEWMMNGKVFTESDSIMLRHGEFNKIRFTNKSFRLHPMHLHGQFFKVISRNGQPVNEHYFRDTVLVGSEETVDIGLVPLDRGTWMNHCHTTEHADAGMMASVIVQ